MNFLLLLHLALLALAPERDRPLTVRQVVENNQALHGQEIVVSGWLETCDRLSCPLYASRREARRNWPDYWLSIGSTAWFDAFAQQNGPGRVTLRARFDAGCVTDPAERVIAACADRARSLDPIALVR